MKPNRTFNLIFSYRQGCFSLIFQIQYYTGEQFEGTDYRGISFGPWLPPFMFLHGKRSAL